MKIYLIRHADAAPLGQDGVTEDALRPLTPLGHDQAKQVAAGLQRRGVHPPIILTSPLLRAKETAEDLASAFTGHALEVRLCEDMAPGGKRRRVARDLKNLGMEDAVAVGHQPDINELAAWLVGSKKAQFEIAKAGAACIECADGVGKGRGTLLWLVPPEWLD